MIQKKYRSDFLFPNNSFLVGMGSILNISGNYFKFNYLESGNEADSKAIESDWGMIGQDFKDVCDSNPCNNMQIA